LINLGNLWQYLPEILLNIQISKSPDHQINTSTNQQINRSTDQQITKSTHHQITKYSMLQAISVQNYALIDKVEIEFMPGLSIITGETGAGKSILLGALSLIMGQRADLEVLRDKNLKCVVEGNFAIGSYNLADFFMQNDLDYLDNTVLRREISTNGKSRAFVNDTPVTLNLLRELSLKLIDIHSQHENLDLTSHAFHLKVLDTAAGLMDQRKEYLQCYKLFRDLEQQFTQMLNDSDKAKSDLEYFQFQYNQLAEAKLMEGEEEELEAEQRLLTHSSEIRVSLTEIHEKLQGEGKSVISLLKDSASLIQKIKDYFQGAEDIFQRLESSTVELKDIAAEASAYSTSVETDPARLELITVRLDLINSLCQKHRLASSHELISHREELEAKIKDITSYDFRVEDLKKELNKATEKLDKLAAKLTQSRNKISPVIEKQVIEMLRELGIPNARFEVKIQPLPDYSPLGKDKVEFMFSANKQTDLQEISRVASGGELSRLMLSVKSLLSRSVDLPTIIFDEIDSGVSGEIAHKMGMVVKEMAVNMQVINITHLPQIAAKGEHHYLVYKKDSKSATHTYIRLLNPEERITEIAKMISGEELTSASYQNARELLGLN
jgi:DNA repair protein RecN (Recombination protein N)